MGSCVEDTGLFYGMYRALLRKTIVGGLRSRDMRVHEGLEICGLFCEMYLGLFYGMDRARSRKDTVGRLGSSEVLVHEGLEHVQACPGA